MSVSITIEISRTFTVNAGVKQAFTLLANVPESASHFPKVERLTDLGDNTFRWEMKKQGVDRYSLQTIYACRYRSDGRKHTIVWEPVAGEGNGTVNGSWTLKAAEGGGTECRFQTRGILELPLPGLLKMAISPVVKHEFNALVDQYIENLKVALAE